MYVGVIFDEAKKRPLILIADTVGGLADAGSSRTAGRTEELES
jgi:hypothetical protein